MKDIFISRPNWISDEFKQGLAKFTSLLKTYDLNPRTLGVSDYPTDSPLDEVITIMNQCVGVIILGYPQIHIEKGLLKGNAIPSKSSVVLATEWNHIEASLAYAKSFPLLVIRHIGVSRGIFDKGALNKYLYEVDLANVNWSTDESILGGINTWKQRLLQKPPLNNIAQNNNLQFEQRSGTFISKTTSFRYCSKCYRSTPPKEVELKVYQSGWKCSVCNSFFKNPDWNPPEQNADNNYIRI
jgi:hypothetical protein